MAIPRRGSRAISVDGRRYRWRVRTRPTAQQLAGASLLLAVAAEHGEGSTLVVNLHRPHPSNAASLWSLALTPAEVSVQIRAAVRAGWEPDRPGPQFRMAAAAHVGPELRTWPGRAAAPTRAELETLARARAPSDYDVLRLTDGGSNLEINGVDLLELVTAVERPLVARELEQRIAAGEQLDPNTANFAGEYLGFGRHQFALPSRELLDAPHDTTRGFVLSPDDPRRGKTTLLGCTCGIVECWFLLARISLFDEFVVWSEFEQFHRYWVYALGPFVFERQRYLAALAS